MSQKNVNRRQFVQKTVAAGAAIAATAGIAKTAGGCPVVYDDNGARVDY